MGEYSDKLSFLLEQNEKLLGIYSRFGRAKSGGGKGGDKGKGGKKWDGGKDKGKGGSSSKGRFNRGAGSSSSSSKSSSGKSTPKFGRGQKNRTSLRSFG